MSDKLKVFYISPEVSPFAKSGEVADVADSLPKYLSALGMDVSIFMPKYRRPEIESLSMELLISNLLVPLGKNKVKCQVFKSELGKYSIFFIDNARYFWRDNIYGSGKDEYLDNDERFVFFNRAVLEFIIKTEMTVDVIHCNNWPTALIPVFLKTHYAGMSRFKKTASVFTVHNVAFQGEFPPEAIALTGLNWDYLKPKGLSFKGKFNFLKGGLLFSDVISTVSSSYRRELMTRKHGFGMENILKDRRKDLFAIRNGIDYENWDPERDPYIEKNYTFSGIKSKKINKQDLVEEAGLNISPNTPLLGLISHFAEHKGFDILLEAIDELIAMEVGLIVMGRGGEEYEKRLAEAKRKHPDRIVVKLGFSPGFTHKIVAGSDIILIPSRYEPCGLNQLYGFRYGTVPVVRAIGGLKETVEPFDKKSLRGNGFVFKEYSPEALLGAIREAVGSYRKPRLWKKIVKAGFRQNFSWTSSAKRYIRLYRHALELKKGA